MLGVDTNRLGLSSSFYVFLSQRDPGLPQTTLYRHYAITKYMCAWQKANFLDSFFLSIAYLMGSFLLLLSTCPPAILLLGPISAHWFLIQKDSIVIHFYI